MVLNSLFPVFAIVLLGYLLKRYQLTDARFLEMSDRLVYFIFFPAMLFWKIGGASSGGGSELKLCTAALCAIALAYLTSAVCIRVFNIGHFQAGTFSQSCYRFNTYIGMAIVMTAIGEQGVRYFGVLIGFAIPFINVLAVSTLIWYSDRQFERKKRLSVTLKSLVANPLIIACVAGFIYSHTIGWFPEFVDNAFSLVSMVTLPLALLSIGGALTLEGFQGHFKTALIAAFVKLLVFPIFGFTLMRVFSVTGSAFQVGMIFFTLPASTAIFVLSSQLNSDTTLASASIVLSTLLSFISLSVALTLFF